MNEKLAKEVIRCVHSIGKQHPHKQINDSVRGENMALGFIKSEGGSTYPKDIELAMGISSARVADCFFDFHICFDLVDWNVAWSLNHYLYIFFVSSFCHSG